MSELFFALKMAAISLVMVILMQIRVGDETIENHAHSWIQTAAPVLFLREVAEGGLAAVHDGWAKMTSNIKTKYWQKFDSASLPGRRLEVAMDRSNAYADEQKAKKEKIENEMAARAKKVKQAIGLEEDDPVAQERE